MYLNQVKRNIARKKINQKSIKNIKLLYELREAVIKLFNGYSSIVSEFKYKILTEKEFEVC